MFNVLTQLFFPAQSSLLDDLHTFRVVPLILERHTLKHNGVFHLDRLVAAGSYDGSLALRLAIQQFKYRHSRHLQDPLGRILSEAAYILSMTDDVIFCPVPLHWTRRFQRGFNQSHILATHVAEVMSGDVEDLLRRTRPTGHQAHRSKDERRTALKNVFRFSMAHTIPSHVILVDDVATTLSTLEECAIELKRVGVERVDGLVLALG